MTTSKLNTLCVSSINHHSSHCKMFYWMRHLWRQYLWKRRLRHDCVGKRVCPFSYIFLHLRSVLSLRYLMTIVWLFMSMSMCLVKTEIKLNHDILNHQPVDNIFYYITSKNVVGVCQYLWTIWHLISSLSENITKSYRSGALSKVFVNK